MLYTQLSRFSSHIHLELRNTDMADNQCIRGGYCPDMRIHLDTSGAITNVFVCLARAVIVI